MRRSSKQGPDVPEEPLFARHRSFLIAVFLALVACYLIDYEIYSRQWFLEHFGYATQEGQIVRKLQWSERAAEVADVIAFGSSYTRSGLSSAPFLENGLLPFNFAVTAGGPLYAYYALDHIAPVLARRSTKPVVLLELSLNSIGLDAAQPGAGWSEYQHLFGVTRSRSSIAKHFLLLQQNFQQYSESSEFLSAALWPSSTYRAYGRVLGAYPPSGLKDFLTRPRKDEYFYGYEDMGGFDPLYDTGPALLDFNFVPLPLEGFVPAKVAFLKLFIERALQLGTKVVLYSAPSQSGYYLSFEQLTKQLESEYPRIQVIRHRDYGLTSQDFDPSGHLNIWGADHFAEWLISNLKLAGDKQRLDRNLPVAYEKVPLPPVASWDFSGTEAAVDNDSPYQLVWTPQAAKLTTVTSPWIPVTANRQYGLEFSALSRGGNFVVTVEAAGPAPARVSQTLTVAEVKEHPGAIRYFLAITPGGSQIRIRISYKQPASDPGGGGSIRLDKLYGHL
jgi:hypothetical protein